MTTFWWVRHGPTHAKGMVGWSDLPADLSDTAQIARLSDYLPRDAPVISSDLKRCVATADAIQGDRARLPHDPDLREIHFGRWEMQTWRQIDESDPELSRAFWDEPGDICAPGGESWHQAQERVSRGADRLLGRQDVIVVAHFGAILTQVQRALGISAYETLGYGIDNLSVTRIQGNTADPINHLP